MLKHALAAAALALGVVARPYPDSDKYTVSLSPIPGVAGNPLAFAVVNVHPGGVVTVNGHAIGLEANLDATADDCKAKNGCGVHIHEGHGCSNTTTQGGHFFHGDADPWAPKGYLTTDEHGIARFNFSVDIGREDTFGRVLVIHANDGSRVACGVMDRVHDRHHRHFAATMVPIPGVSTSAHGLVNIVAENSGSLVVLGRAELLEHGVNAEAGDCDAPNGCGMHVHSGVSCDTIQAQAGHFFGLPEDPWAHSGYTHTDRSGAASFKNHLETGRTDIQGHAFVGHDSTGARITCGLIHALD